MNWALIEEEDGDVNCPVCGRLKDKIVDYGVFDDDSYYFVVKCNCGVKYAYLSTTDFKARYVGVGNFNTSEVVYSGSVSDKISTN